ncbi:cytosolic protein [Lentibacillus juripiscarius]|uniref:Cytosolic protein n=1 Tax=Lentibacillus juripiscarius TaxID=257446 RepID=A0ABW5VA95_9BACI
MPLRQTIARYFSDHAETNDSHTDPLLQTHYYKITADKGVTILESLFRNDPLYDIHASSSDRGEISATITERKKAFIVATVTMVKPLQTAIDFSVTTESFLRFDLGFSHKVIQRLYAHTDKELPLVKNIEQQPAHR